MARDALTARHENAPDDPGRHRRAPAVPPLALLQAQAGNRAVSAAVQRISAEQQVIAALDKADPVAGVGDFPAAFHVLNGLNMADMLLTLFRLQATGRFQTLQAHIGEASGVNLPRLRLAFDAASAKAAGTNPNAFAGRTSAAWNELPTDQQATIGAFLDPSWRPTVPLAEIPGAADTALGAEYARGVEGDGARLAAAEDEIDRRSDTWGTALARPPARGTPGTTQVTPEVAIKMLENLSKGEPAFKPELGKGGASWFVTEGNPYVGIGDDKTISVETEISMKGATRIGEAELLAMHEQAKATYAAEAEAQFREHYKVPADKPLNSRLRKALERFTDKFAESKMWDKVAERAAASPSKVAEVVLENSKFSKQGNGKFAVVTDASKIKLKGGPSRLLAAVEGSLPKAEPVAAEAVAALAKKMKWAGKVRGVFRWGGRLLIVVAIAADAYTIYHAEDKVKAVVETVGGWAGASAGATAFAALWAPADVAGPAAWAVHGVGTLVAGGIGYWVGSELTRTVYELVVTD